ncbi:MAG: serine hydrolase domain-containing protein [Acidimicrobiia bacterium]
MAEARGAPLIEGDVAPGWEPVREAFAANFTDRGDLGAAVAVVHRGQTVVDLVGGHRDRDRTERYGHDTLQLVFSTTKGMASVCVGLCVQRGWLDPTDLVSRWWPELPVGDLTVEQLLSHQAGLITVQPSLTLTEILDWDTVVRALEATTPMWPPGSRHGYHAITFGWLAGEIVRRCDPRGRAIGQFLADEIAAPLGLEMWIGLPEELEPRVARLRGAPLPSDPQVLATLAARTGPGTLGDTALTMGGAIAMGGPWNAPQVHRAQLAGANGITNARSLARMYGALSSEVDGVRLFTDDTMEEVRRHRVGGFDVCLGRSTRFGLGFMLANDFNPMLGPGSFGHGGAGGSLAFADPQHQLGFGYVMNQMQTGIDADPRPAALVDAVRRCLVT